jgi:aminobenzoyl-glutamate transport protein
MVKTFTDFPPLGVVLVALLGVGVAEHTGFLNACLKGLLRITAKSLLTPMLVVVSILSHAAGDAGYVLVIPLGGVIFATAGRHPLAGIACTFAGVSGGFSASFLPVLLDPLLQGFTQSAAQIIDPNRTVNPLCNWYFTSASCLVIIGVAWWLTDRVIEPRLRRQLPADAITEDLPRMDVMTDVERRALWAGLAAMAVALVALAAAALPANSPLRSKSGELAGHGAPLMESIVPLIFLLFLLPAVIYGYLAGTVRSHKDVIQGMSKSMATMSYYLVMAFFAAQFTYVFRESNVGALLALKGAGLLQSWHLPGQMTIIGIIIITALVNLLIGSASAKWALLGPIFVPMLMQVGLSPELTQAAYRIADSSANIITPLLPYFPLIVVYCQRYVKSTGIGTLVSMMLPYSIGFLVAWTIFLMLYWALGLPLGLQATYRYP